MKKQLLIGCALLCSFYLKAQEEKIFIKPLPDSLRANAHAVLQEELTVVEVKSASRATVTVNSLQTILDEAAKNELTFNIGVNKFSSLDNVLISVYDASGTLIKSYTKKDLASYVYDENLVADGRQYSLTIPVTRFPVHIRKEYVIKYNGFTALPDFYVQQYEQAVRNSTFRMEVPSDIDIRVKQYHYNEQPAISVEKNNKIYSWTVSNRPALQYEEGSVPYGNTPIITFAPNKFSLDGNEGDISSWKTFGQWYAELGKHALDLPEETKAYINELVKGAATEREKAARIYKHLQNNFRYVSIQLGIGGFKPFNASFTDKKKYGDCKALSNYTQACLAAVGIRSHQALINAGFNRAPVDPQFPANGFNHVIVCVPMEKDSLWLECTSNTNEFGVLGGFTENRNALLITENGGVLVSTPKSRATDNQMHVFTTVKLLEDGSGTALVRVHTTGDFRAGDLMKENEDHQRSFFVSALGFPAPDVMEVKGGQDRYTAEMDFTKVPSFSAGSKMFLHPSMHTFTKSILPANSDRASDYYFHMPYVKHDTTVYQLPSGYKPDKLPAATALKFSSGSFNLVYDFNTATNELRSVSKLNLSNHIIPAAKYNEAKAFYDSVMASYKNKVVVVRE